MSRPLLYQEITFSGDASAQNCVAYVPPSLIGLYTEFTIYIEFSANAAAGKVQIETAFPSADPQSPTYAGTWALVGNTIDWAAGASQKYASVTGVFALLRCRIDTAVTSGSVRAFIVAASHGG